MTSAFEELKNSRHHLISSFSAGEIAGTFQLSYAEIMDHYFRSSLQESKIAWRLFKEKTPFASVAVGGYGRKELSLYSDIDIVVLFKEKIPSRANELIREVFFPLWDLGLDISYSIRNIKDCLTLSKDDFKTLTSMNDARFICGDFPLYLSFAENLQTKVISKKAKAFFSWLEDQNVIRMGSFGDASHVLEPNLKEGIGGLRDYHHVLWLGRAFFQVRAPRDLEYLGILSHKEYQELSDQLNFIWLVRNHLHHRAGRKNDRLAFEYQEEIAQRLAFQDRKDSRAVEQFLGRLHSSMATIKSLRRSFINSHLPKRRGAAKSFGSVNVSKGLHLHREEINFDSATAIISDPPLLLKIFEQSCHMGCSLSMEAKRLVREFLYLVDDTFRESEKAVKSFLGIIDRGNTFETLEQMYETRFLEAFIPEFAEIRDRVQYDTYHIFPVGTHVLETVRYLKSLPTEREILLQDVFSGLSNPEPLFLAGLFHDIGKVGKDHAREGAAIVRNILKRLNYERRGAEDIHFLVRHHLLLVDTATKRDLNDEKMVVQCARTVEDTERLKMLYLLTWADARATGPRAWNEWISNLVQELFFKMLHILEKGELATAAASQEFKRVTTEVRREIGNRINKDDLDGLFEVMSPRYLLNTPPRDIVRHIKMIQQLREDFRKPSPAMFLFQTQKDEIEGCWEVTFIGKDRPGLFSDFAGVLALNNINILSADIYTWRDGTAVDIFRTTSPLDRIRQDEIWKKVKRDLEKIFSGKLSLAYRLGEKAGPSILSESKKPTRQPVVVVDNESSDFFTLIEVFANDRVGLLYLITHTLFELHLDIRIAKIVTKGAQIADVFYVRDLEGQKVEDKEHVEEIRGALLHQLRQG